MGILRPVPGSWRLRLVAVTAVALLVSSAGFAQRRGGRGGFVPSDVATPESFDGAFNFCRVAFSNASNGAGAGWSVDYPRADQNLPTRLSELTKTPISRNRFGLPNHLLLRFTDQELFRCPFVMITEPGGLFLYDDEAAALRDYLLKGGFLWADDFWGEYAWDVWESQIRKSLPSGPYPIKDLPLDHPLFHMMFSIREVTQIASINYWRGSGGGTSENGFDSQVPHARAISDDHGRIMVLITHNTDFGDSWEQEAQDPEFFERFSVPGYAFGINSVLYAMTH